MVHEKVFCESTGGPDSFQGSGDISPSEPGEGRRWGQCRLRRGQGQWQDSVTGLRKEAVPGWAARQRPGAVKSQDGLRGTGPGAALQRSDLGAAEKQGSSACVNLLSALLTMGAHVAQFWPMSHTGHRPSWKVPKGSRLTRRWTLCPPALLLPATRRLKAAATLTTRQPWEWKLC